MSELIERLARNEVFILDGGVSTELQRRGVPMSERAWSGAAALSHPDEVQAVHEAYIAAGADIITCNTYAAARFHLSGTGLEARVGEVNRRAVELASRARDRAASDRTVWIAGSMSLMAPSFDSRLRPNVAAIEGHFREQAEVLTEAGVDLIVLEMLRDIDYSRAAVDAAVSTGLPVCSGFSCAHMHGADLVMSAGVGHPLPLREVLKAVLGRGESLVALMHSDVDITTSGIAAILESWHGPVAAYPNSGRFEPPNWQFVDVVSPEGLARAAARWVDMGVQIVGGCCGVGPEHIARLSERLPRRRG